MRFSIFRVFVTFILVLFARAAAAETSNTPSWQDSFTGRLEALAIFETLNADLLSHDSATLTLNRWCGDHRLAPSAHVVPELIHGVDRRRRSNNACCSA